MKHLYTTLLVGMLCVATALPLTAQNVSFDWAYRVGGDYHDYGKGIAADASGNVFVSGNFGYSGYVDFDPGAGVVNLTGGGVFLQKMSPTRNLIWVKQIKGAEVSSGGRLIIDASGNVYIVGGFSGTQDLDPGAAVLNHSTNAASNSLHDVFIMKLDASGNLVWVKQIGTPTSDDNAYDITTDKAGNLLIFGTHTGLTDFDPNAGTQMLDGQTGKEFILKLTTAGNFVWVKNFGYSNYMASYCIATDNNDNIFTSGYYFSKVDMDPGPDTAYLTVTNSLTNRRAFVQKLDANGNFKWAKQIGTTKVEGFRCTTDNGGNVYLTGDFGYYSNEDFDPGPNIVYLSTITCVNAFLLKLDSLGNFVWANAVGSSIGSHGLSIVKDIVGNIYTSGYYWNGDFDPGPATAYLSAAGSFDVYVQKLDANGNFIWVQGIGGTAQETGNAVCVDGAGNVFVTGKFEGTIDADPGAATYNLTAHDNTYNDFFVVKLKQDGFTTGIEQTAQPQMKLYPNPTSGKLTVIFGITYPQALVEVKDIAGRTLYSETINSVDRAVLDIDHAPGVYFVSVASGDKRSVFKVIRQ